MSIVDVATLPEATPLLLDTPVWTLTMLGDRAALAAPLSAAIERAAHAGRLFVSAASIWELGRQVEDGRLRIPDLGALVTQQERPPGITVLPISRNVTVAAHRLVPGPCARDAAARFLVATAHERSAALVTMDADILAFAASHPVLVSDARPRATAA